MNKTPDITIHLPSEYFEALSEVMASGLDHAHIPSPIRHQLKAWWEAESQFIRDDLNGE